MKVGLALGGGSSHGLAHIGVLEVLEEEKIPIHFIAGTSIGAVIGGYYALYKDAKKLKEITKEILESPELKNIGFNLFGNAELPKPFRDVVHFVKEKYIHAKSLLKPYIVKADKLNQILEKMFGDALISETKIPFAAVAIDLVEGKDKVIREGRIRDAVRASASIPGVFPSVESSLGILVDGGATSTLPTSAVKEMGADFVICSSFMGELSEVGELRTAFQINLRVDEIVKHRLNSLNLVNADIIISPDFHEVHWSDFSKADFLMERGREAALKSLPKIKRELGLFGRIKRWSRQRL